VPPKPERGRSTPIYWHHESLCRSVRGKHVREEGR
jgi:hypothetical protein